MKLPIFIIFTLIIEIHGCATRRSATTTTTTTTTTTRRTPVEEQRVRGSNISPNLASQKSGAKVETAELRALSEELYKMDSNAVGSLINVNYQGKTSSDQKNDVAPNPLFPNMNYNILRGPTWSTFLKLLDNYVADVKIKEDNTNTERSESNAFLDAVMNTNVMKKAEEFLKRKGYISGSLRPELQLIWFTPYSRHRGIIGSSGFEHVFLGEIKKGKISGFHNWLYFQREEKENDVNYKGYLKTVDLGDKGEILKMKFDWMNKPKQTGSMFIGTSPELEMALYTVCFYTRGNKNCNLQMGGKRFSIKVYQQDNRGKKVIGSAYPQI